MNRYSEINKFGGYTWEVKIDSIFRLLFHETNEKGFLIEFQEFKWIRNKTIWSITSNTNLETAIVRGFDKLFEYFQNSKDYLWTSEQKENKCQETLNIYKNSKYYETSKTNANGFIIIDKAGEYILEILRKPELMPWGKYQIHFKAKTPDHFTKTKDDNGIRHETLYIELWVDSETIENLGTKAKCLVDNYTDVTTGDRILDVIGIDKI